MQKGRQIVVQNPLSLASWASGMERPAAAGRRSYARVWQNGMPLKPRLTGVLLVVGIF